MGQDWSVGEFCEHGGYDCMYAGISVGKALLCGSAYGQDACKELTPEIKQQMLKDAALIGSAQLLLQEAENILLTQGIKSKPWEGLRAAVAKAKGEV